MKHRTGAGTLRWLLCLVLMLGLMLALGTTAYATNKRISVGTTWNIGDSFNLTNSGQTVIIDDRNDHWIINNETTNTKLTAPVYQNGRWEFTNFLTANPNTTNLSGLCLGTGTTNGTEEVSGIVCISGNGSLNYPYKFALIAGPSQTYSVIVIPGNHMTRISGEEQQSGLGVSAMQTVSYKADDDYFFDSYYSSSGANGIKVSRYDDDPNPITNSKGKYVKIYGTPTANTVIKLADPSPKTPLATPSAVFTPTGPDSGTLTNVTTAMYYRVGESGDWTKITGTSMSLTGLSNGDIIQVYQPASVIDAKTHLDSAIQSIIVSIPDGPCTVTVVPGEHLIKTEDSGEAQQTVEYSAIADVIYTPEDGYYFPTTYSVEAVNGITVKRNSYTKITVSGMPTADAVIALPAPAAKEKLPTPEAVFTPTGPDSGTLANVTTAMYYRVGKSGEWTKITGTPMSLTGLSNGDIIQVYQPVTPKQRTNCDSDIQSITVTMSGTSTSVTITAGSNMTKTTDSGEAQQTGLTGEMTAVVYEANAGYHFTEFADITNNGITATRTSDTVVTVSGTPTGDASITIPDAVKISATAPTISGQPQNLGLTYGYTSGSLSVTATAAAGHNLSYQWYSNTTNSNEGGTIINENGTNASYAIPTGKAVGTTEYYYCVVTATRADNGETATLASNAATVTVSDSSLEPISYLNWNGSELVEDTCTLYTVVTDSTTTFEDGKWYVVNENVSVANGITVSGTAHLILCNGATLTVDGGQKNAGICVCNNNSLTIYGQSTEESRMGKLNATGGWFSAGIGGRFDYIGTDHSCGDGGTITINGGSITAAGCQARTNGVQQTGGAGIGGAYYHEGGTITINGGIVDAVGGIPDYYGSAGIGTGYWGGSTAFGNTGTTVVTINGGTVTATGASGGAGIGGGYKNRGGTFNINGGTVTANGKGGGAGIGGGLGCSDHGTVILGEGVRVKAGDNADTATDVTSTFAASHTQAYAKTEKTDSVAYSVTITPGDNMTKTTDSGEAQQTGLSGEMVPVVYTANEGYYFPTDYSVAEVNGISVTRDSYTQITVSGTPTADAAITLTAPTAKTKPDAPTTAAAVNCTTADSNDGKLTGVTTAMEYKKSDAADWTAGTGNDITGLAPGTYYVRYKATDTALASDNQELTIKILQTITAEDVTANYGETGKSIVATTDGDGALSYAVKSGDAVTVDSSTGALTIAKVGTAVITVTAAETQTYAQTTKDINVTVGKANPTANAPTGLTATYGQTLADVSLEGKNPEGNTPGTWAWAYAETTSVGDVGTNTFKANFTPTDTANYNSVENVDVTVKVKLGEPRIAGYDLVLDGVLGLRCYVEVPEGFDGTDAAMTFSMPYRENQVIQYSEAETDAEGRKVFTCNVYAYQMADKISVSFAYQKDGETKYVTDTYSVKEYLDKVEADTSSEETLALVNATRNYGHYVQPYLYRLGTGVYQTEMPAGTGTPDINAAKTGSAAKAVQSTGAYLDSTRFSGAIIRLNVNTGTDLVFELKPVAGFAEQLTATVDDGTSYPVTLNDRGVYRIAKQTIAANNLEVGSSFTVKHDTENVFTITASPMNYISLVLGQSTADDERYALAALYEYWAAADGYNHPGA